MKNTFAVIGVLVVGFAALGWYFEWYKLGTEPGADGHRKINADVNTKKIVEDVKKGGQKVSDLINSDNKGSTPQTPVVTPNNEKKVETTGFQFESDGSVKIVLPKVEFKTTGQ